VSDQRVAQSSDIARFAGKGGRAIPFAGRERNGQQRFWDSFHAASSALATLALVVLLIDTLRDTPASFARMRNHLLNRILVAIHRNRRCSMAVEGLRPTWEIRAYRRTLSLAVAVVDRQLPTR